MARAAISTQGLSKDYGGGRGLFDLDLEVAEGEVFGFLGPNGAGKSTAIRLLMGLSHPSGGSATVFGMDATTQSVEIKRLVGYLPGELPQFGGMRGGQVLSLLAGLHGGADRAYVTDVARRLDVDLSRRYRDYSRGNKQKLALVGALMTRPRLLVLDEPTGGLDPLVQQEFYRLIHEVKEGGATVFMSSHIFADVEHTCDRVGIIRAGRLVRAAGMESIHRMRVHRVSVTFDGALDASDLEGVDGVSDVSLDQGRLECRVQGVFSPLLAVLGKVRVTNLVSQEPSLEEVFLTYYGDGEDARQGQAVQEAEEAREAGEDREAAPP